MSGWVVFAFVSALLATGFLVDKVYQVRRPIDLIAAAGAMAAIAIVLLCLVVLIVPGFLG